MNQLSKNELMAVYKFQLLNYYWTVKLVEPTDKELILNGSLVLGLCDNSNFVIYINKELSEQLLLRVFRHEVSHAVLCSCLDCAESFNEEDVCNYIADYASTILQIEKDFILKYKLKV